MTEEKRIFNSKHSVYIENRDKITVMGVVDVLSFDEQGRWLSGLCRDSSKAC